MSAARRRRCRRTEWVHETYLKRDEFGEFHHIMKDLYNDHILIHGYVRMKKETFHDDNAISLTSSVFAAKL